MGSLINIKTTGAACQVCWSGWETQNPWTWGRRRRTCWWPRQSDFSPAALVSCHRCAVKESKVKCNCTDRRNIKGARIILSSAVLLWIEQKAFNLTPQSNKSSILQLINWELLADRDHCGKQVWKNFYKMRLFLTRWNIFNLDKTRSIYTRF